MGRSSTGPGTTQSRDGRKADTRQPSEKASPSRPLRTFTRESEEALLAELEAAGRLVRGHGDLLDIKPRKLPPGAEPPSRILARMRADER